MKPKILALVLAGVLLVLTLGFDGWLLGSSPAAPTEVPGADGLMGVATLMSPDRPLEMIRELQRIDASWSLAAMRTMAIPQSDFDAVAGYLPRVRELRSGLLNSELASTEAPRALDTALRRFLSLGEAKEEAIERFKSNFAAMRNSQRYLPLAYQTLLDTEATPDLVAVIAKLRTANGLLAEFMQSPSETARTEIGTEMDVLEQGSMAYPPSFANALNNYVSHARVLLERKIPMTEILARVVDESAVGAGAEVVGLYRDWLVEQDHTQRARLRGRQLDAAAASAQAMGGWRWMAIALGSLIGVLGVLAALLWWREARTSDARLAAELAAQAAQLAELRASGADDKPGANQAALGRMAATLAHEINTPLGYLAANMELIEGSFKQLDTFMEECAHATMTVPDETPGNGDADGKLARLCGLLHTARSGAMVDEIPGILGDMNGGIEQIQHLINDLRGFSTVDREEHTWVDLNACIDKGAKLASPKFGDQVALRTELGDLPRLRGSSGQLTQVFTNLLVNAAQAVVAADRGAAGRVMISSKRTGDLLVVNVVDNGVGIPEQDTKRIFEPFVTTKGPSEGTGLGLSIVARIVTRHGGRIRLKSEPGKGTNFQVVLPIGAPQDGE